MQTFPSFRNLSAAAAMALAAGTTMAASPQIDSIDKSAATRSGLVVISGSNFGASQDAPDVVLIGGAAAIATTWSDTEIHAYVPEAASLGGVDVQVVTDEGPSNAVPLTVEMRSPDGRVQWRFEFDTVFSGQFQSVGPDGTIYANDNLRLYAISPDGGLKWVSDASSAGKPIDFLADGTLITANSLEVVALDPADGSVVWSYLAGDAANQISLHGGPSIGPDGNVYAVTSVDGDSGAGLGAFSLTPDGQFRWNNQADPLLDPISAGNNNIITFTENQAYLPFVFAANSGPAIYAFGLDGQQRGYIDECASLPRTNGVDRLYTSGGSRPGGGGQNDCGVRALDEGLNELWTFEMETSGVPVVGADGSAYTGGAFGDLVKVNPDGTEGWRAGGVDFVDMLGVTPDQSVVLFFALENFGLPNDVKAYAGDGSELLWSERLRSEDRFHEIWWSRDASFSPGADTAYFITRWTGNAFNGALYAVAVTDGPPACPADLDGDGDADVNDFFTYLDLFAAGDARADINGDGSVDVNDFFSYLDLFAQGC